MDRFTIVPSGRFSLRESVEFGFGQRHSETFDGVMRLAFCLDGRGYRRQVGVALTQDADGVHGAVQWPADRHSAPDELAAVQAQVARILSLDHDIAGFEDVGARDPVIGRLQQVAPGLLPPLFHSPYEAAVWSVLSARRPAKQMAEVRQRLSEAHGQTFELAGRVVAALPTPEQLLQVREFPSIPAEKLTRIHAVAESAAAGQLDVQRLRSLGPEAATADVQRLKGIGPFYASLITVRALGFADVLPEEPIAQDLIRRLYHAPAATRSDIEEIAEKWRPYRTWATVLIRAASSRLP